MSVLLSSFARLALFLLAVFPSWVQCSSSESPMKRAPCPALPSSPQFSDTALPDPFTFLDGAAVTTLGAWTCRQAEVNSLFQINELGTKPPPPSTLTATLSSSNALAITASEAGKSITFTPTISFPTTGTAPFPAIIAFNGLSFPRPAGVALITFNVDDMAQQVNLASRGQGKFFTLYGANATASAMMAWAWGVSRIIDALEMTPNARIDTKRIAVTGCSRNGKGALVAGAFDTRIALTIPQESGSGGTDCWRLSDALQARGVVTQTASEIVQENVWFSRSFETFANTSVNMLPVDHHMLAGLVAPRALFVIDNVGIDWLGAESSFGCMKSARRIWQALGASNNMGYSQAASHDHCSFPASQQAVLTAFINKFLLGLSANTTVTETAGNYMFDTPGVWDPWNAPQLA
ncbi:hypothetical protein FPV67DRAFT_746357 [Lyophyllum atratum]|nr:hypothetical protein FPV67DRAFT_746357 [Lyophyllum atratum]